MANMAHTPDMNRSAHRSILERVVVEGELCLETPAHFGAGVQDDAELTDMAVLRDELDGTPLLTGATLAGALRNYLAERELNYEYDEWQAKQAIALLGGVRGDEEGAQSMLIVHDSLGQVVNIELRDGVRIDPVSRTAEAQKKFDMQLLPAGSRFPLRFELLIPKNGPNMEMLLTALSKALDGLARGEISLGKRKRRGFGRCHVSQWQVKRYNLSRRADLLAWIAEDQDGWVDSPKSVQAASIASALGVPDPGSNDDHRSYFDLKAEFLLEGSILIRSGFGEADIGPDVVHLHALHGGDSKIPQPVLPGTSLAGALRGRALRIARTLASAKERAPELINNIFGPEEISSGETGKASRLEVSEQAIRGGCELVQNRVRIDRFTGGAADTALIDEQPLYGNDQARLQIHLRLRKPKDEEAGLLLLLLKDLWTGDLALGGESNIGRGRLRGRSAILTLKDDQSGAEAWEMSQEGSNDELTVLGQRDRLETFVTCLKNSLTEEGA